MGFETPAIKPKIEKKPDLYDLAREDMMRENDPQKNQEELSEEEKRISAEVAYQLQREEEVQEGFLQKIADKTKAKIAVGTFLAITALASVAEARGGESLIGREAERAVGRVINDAARGVGEWLGNIFRRGGSGETPREQERRVREIQQEDNDFNREYFQIMRQYERDAERIMREYDRDIERLQSDYSRRGETIPEENKKEVQEIYENRLKQVEFFYAEKVKKINESHSLRHRDEKGNNITGCRYPNGFPLPQTRSNF